MTAAFTDRTSLRTAAYADARPLETRRAIYAYRRPELDLVGEIVHRLGDVPPGVVADVGCGSGAYARALRAARPDLSVVAFDLSSGMVGTAGQPGVVADAMELPLADRSCTAVLALHMLYHVPDPARAVREYARVLSSGGSCVIAGNAGADKAELGDLWARATKDVHGTADVRLFGRQLMVDDMEGLARAAFPVVERFDYRGHTVVPEPGPVLAFLESTRHLNPTPDFDTVLTRAAEILDAVIAAEGAFTFTNHLGVLRAMPC